MCVNPASLETKRTAALEFLGTNWLLHSAYSAAKNPHHSLSHHHSARLLRFCDEMASLRAESKPTHYPFLRP